MTKNKDFVIAIGGSIVAPDDINKEFLKKFHVFIKEKMKNGFRFIIVVGGGGIARKYQNAFSEIMDVSDEDKDLLGIQATRLNAQLLKTLFREEAHPEMFNDRFQIKTFGGNSLIIGSGWRPGWSTDFVACQIACDFKIEKVVILGKPAYVYTASLEKDKNAQPLERITWENYLELIPSNWSPGLNSPVDPIAAHLAQKEKLKVIVAAGNDLVNFRKILNGDKFKGTVITNS